LDQSNITAQLIGYPDSLIGSRISVGRTGAYPGALVCFDGTNYLLVWRENNHNLNGQFINTSGGLVGSFFSIATNASLMHPGDFGLAYNDTSYMAIFVKTDTMLYGQRISRNGSLIGGQIQISSNRARDISMAYDGANYLVAWVEVIEDTDKDIYGQFVSKTGSLTGSNFLIDGGPYYSDNPTALSYDGSRYLLVYHETPDTNENPSWTLKGRFITALGELQDSILVCDPSLAPGFPSVSFDNTNYLITWAQFTNMSVMGRFWSPAGAPVDAPFVVFDSLSGRITVGGSGFGGSKYLAVCTRLEYTFTNGDVYARFIDPLNGVEGKENRLPASFVLSQSYPNPAGGPVVISYQLAKDENVELKVYDMLGRAVKTLASGRQSAGSHSIRLESGNLPNGVYFYRLKAGAFSETQKLVLMR
jgi:hypothetical protein